MAGVNARDHQNFYRNAARRRAEKKHLTELRERATRGEELLRDPPQKPQYRPAVQKRFSFEKGVK